MTATAASVAAAPVAAVKAAAAAAEEEIPVWVNSRQRWVTGVNRKTTCDDVIAVLLRSEAGADDAPLGGGDTSGYAIMERWRRVERPLEGHARILRVWRAWGDAQGDVRLTLRRLHGPAPAHGSTAHAHEADDSGRGSPPPGREPAPRRARESSSATPPPRSPPAHPRRRRHHQHHHRHRHRERHADLPHKLPDTIEKLMKLILAQGETIHSQLRKLQEREDQIETLEDETHRARVQALGSNYLLETYLGMDAEGEEEEEKGNDSGVVTEGSSEQAATPEAPGGGNPRADDYDSNFADESDECTKEEASAQDAALLDLKTQVDLWEKLVKINKRLEREEETLVRLHVKLRRLQSERVAAPRAGDADAVADAPAPDVSAPARRALQDELERVGAQLQAGARELERTTRSLAEADALLGARTTYLRRLQLELDASDQETERLQREIAASIASTVPVLPPAPEGVPAKTNAVATKLPDADSNSDTGLSSLHSGSEEGVYILDTLV